MAVTIKLLPTADEHVGVVHPLDGPLAAEGSDWTHDAFTERRIQEGVVRRAEAEPAPTAKARPAAKAAE